MCNVPGCKEAHQFHYCKNCHDSNSGHFSSSCPQLNNNNIVNAGGNCKVNGCTEAHTKHYCKICKDADSNHFSSNCNAAGGGGIRGANNPRVTFQRDPNKCKVPGCPQEHKKHFCKYCKNEDSNHRSHQCHKKSCCRVRGCRENHKTHLCQVCRDQDSNHHSRQCPKGIILYHGSAGENLASIVANKLRVCKGGRIGDGIYFTRKDYAGTIAEHRSQGKGEIIVVECVVNES